MRQSILVSATFLAVGVAAGALGILAYISPQLQESREDAATLESELERFRARVEAAEAESKELAQHLAEAEKRAAARDDVAETPPETATASADLEDGGFSLANVLGQVGLQGMLEEPGEPSGGPRPEEDLTPEEREERAREWRARRDAFAGRMREGVEEFWEDRIAAAPTPASQDRMAALRDATTNAFELGRALRDAESPEERDALLAQLEAEMEAAREMVQTEQRELLNSVAERYGITDDGKQAQLVQDLQEVLQDPVFRIPAGGGGMMGGFGGGWRGGGGRWAGRPGPAEE